MHVLFMVPTNLQAQFGPQRK